MIKSYLILQGHAEDPFLFGGQAAAQALSALQTGARGYAQSRLLQQQINTDLPYCGFAELWFDSPRFAAALDTAAFNEALLVEGVEVAAVVTGHERVVMRSPEVFHTTYIKGVFPFCRAPALSVEQFQQYWWQQHAPLAAVTQDALCYLQLHPLPELYDSTPPLYDGVTEFYWPTADAAASAMSSAQMREVQAPDAQNFVDTESVLLFLAREEHVVGM